MVATGGGPGVGETGGITATVGIAPVGIVGVAGGTTATCVPVRPRQTESTVCKAVRFRQGQANIMRFGSSKKLRANVR